MDNLSEALQAAFDALGHAEAARGGGRDPEAAARLAEFVRMAIQTAPAQFANRGDMATLPAWALVVLARHCQASGATALRLEQAEDELRRLRFRLLKYVPKRNHEDWFFDDYLDCIEGRMNGRAFTKQGALRYIANAYGKSEGAMFSALKRERSYRVQAGKLDPSAKVLPRNPSETTSKRP